eukprot:NODE_2950_length_2117_cov_19.990452.p1 GENE.NODE_2950_length_2117_cov_19.990452~~NODE_2950_length_2117_cov_19.990452.p1  ORF type:complete len:603 (+),score=105.47 NODE_2950_length_2117_cov_19.990452:272-1810(+)
MARSGTERGACNDANDRRRYYGRGGRDDRVDGEAIRGPTLHEPTVVPTPQQVLEVAEGSARSAFFSGTRSGRQRGLHMEGSMSGICEHCMSPGELGEASTVDGPEESQNCCEAVEEMDEEMEEQRLKETQGGDATDSGVGGFPTCADVDGVYAQSTDLHRQVWLFLANGDQCHWPHLAKLFEMFTAALIVLNLLADILDSMPEVPFSEDDSPEFKLLEYSTCLVFTVEFVLRAWSCNHWPHFNGGAIAGRLRYIGQGMPLLDLVVLLVFYADIMSTSDKVRGFQSLRVVRALRLLTLLKMERRMNSFTAMFRVVAKKRRELEATVFMATVLLIMASTAMFFVERTAQPEAFDSIPSTMWWAVTALTTVGYGDMYPKTLLGRVLGSCVAFLGIGLFALPSGILGSGFHEVCEEAKHVQTFADAEYIADVIDEDTDELVLLTTEVTNLHKRVDSLQKSIDHECGLGVEMRRDQQLLLDLLRQAPASIVTSSYICKSCRQGEVHSCAKETQKAKC